MAASKMTKPRISEYHTSMLCSAPKAIHNAIELCVASGATLPFYLVVCCRATKTWNDRLSASKCFLWSQTDVPLNPNDLTYYTNHTESKMNGIDQRMWVDAVLEVNEEGYTVLRGAFDVKVKRTVGTFIPNPEAILDEAG